MVKILVVEDNELLGSSMKQGLSEFGWAVDLARDGEEGLFYAENSQYDLLLIDRMLPKLSGMELIDKIRKGGNQTPTIIVTARGSLQDRVTGLECGADDYVVKPFELAELIARVKALYRRSQGRGRAVRTYDQLTLDTDKRLAYNGSTPMDLTSKEFDLLAVLLGTPNKLFSRRELSALLYEFDDEPESNSIDVLMARLRKKIRGSGVALTTVRSKGFVYRVEEIPS